MQRNASLIFCALLAAGCAGQVPARTATQLMPPPAQTALSDVHLNAGPAVTRIAPDVRRLVIEDMRFWADKAGAGAADVQLRLTTVGDLKKQHAFANSYLSDDTQVVVAHSEGRFAVGDAANKSAPKREFGRMIGMYDPVNGETLGTGFMP